MIETSILSYYLRLLFFLLFLSLFLPVLTYFLYTYVFTRVYVLYPLCIFIFQSTIFPISYASEILPHYSILQ